jgi:hypothetical protein
MQNGKPIEIINIQKPETNYMILQSLKSEDKTISNSKIPFIT